MSKSAAAACLAAALFAGGAAAAADLTLRLDGETRRAEVTAAATTPAPFIIALHDEGMTPKDLRRITGLEEVGVGLGFAWPRARGGRWASAANPETLRHNRGAGDDMAFLDALIERLEADGRMAPGQVFLAGYGRGGMMAWRYACARADRIVGFAMIAALPHAGAPCDPRTAAAALFILGDADPHFPRDGGPMGVRRYPPAGWGDAASLREATAIWFARNACDGWAPTLTAPLEPTGLSLRKRSAAGCAAPLRELVLEGAGHYWPGGDEIEAAPINGRRPLGVNASREIVRLFGAAY